MVQFQFAPANHTVTQSTFAEPCQPIALNLPGTKGFYSGFMPVTAQATSTPTYTIMINNTTPIWIYCSQGKHCQAGMTMVINQAATGNKTLEAFKALAKQATANLAGDATSANGSTSSTSSGSSGSSSNNGGSTGSTTTSAGTSQSTSSASVVRVQDALTMGGVLAVAMVLLL